MKHSKKGFTLVELLVVIAILAILATVSVVGYTSFIAKANLSNDQQTIKMINDNLTALFIADEPESAGEAINALRTVGIYGEKLVAYSAGFHYVYSMNTNSFVLADETGAIVYPENADTSNLWALYSNISTDKVPGVTQYVATGTVTGAVGLVLESGYTFDLAQNVCLSNAVAGVKAQNGKVTQSGWTLEGNNAAQQMEAVNFSAVTSGATNKVITLANKQTFDNNATQNVAFKGCVFIYPTTSEYDSTLQVHNNSSYNITFEGCTFIDCSGWALQIDNFSTGTITVKNCEFINCRSGIAVDALNGNVEIEGNTFYCDSSAEKGSDIQLATDNVLENASAHLTIKNNNFVTGYSAVLIHYQLNQDLTGRIIFENNTYGTFAAGKVAARSKATSELHTTTVNYVNSIIK